MPLKIMFHRKYLLKEMLGQRLEQPFFFPTCHHCSQSFVHLCQVDKQQIVLSGTLINCNSVHIHKYMYILKENVYT